MKGEIAVYKDDIDKFVEASERYRFKIISYNLGQDEAHYSVLIEADSLNQIFHARKSIGIKFDPPWRNGKQWNHVRKEWEDIK